MNEKSYGFQALTPLGAINGSSGSTSLIQSGQDNADQPPQLELPQVMQRLAANCDNLAKASIELEMRLGPIMRPCPPAPTCAGEKLSYGSPLAQAIDERNASLAATLEVLSALFARIQL